MKYKLITTGLIAGAFLLFGGHAMADDAVDKNRSAQMNAEIMQGGLQLQDINATMNFTTMSASTLLTPQVSATIGADGKAQMIDSNSYVVGGTPLTGKVLNYSASPDWELQATFTGFRLAKQDINTSTFNYDPNGVLLPADLSLFGKKLLADTPTTILEGGESFTKSAGSTPVVASGFGTTSLDDFGVIPQLTVYKSLPAGGTFMGQINFTLTQTPNVQ